MQKSILPQFEISNFEKFGFPKNWKSPPQNLKFDCDFELLKQKFDFDNLKIRKCVEIVLKIRKFVFPHFF